MSLDINKTQGRLQVMSVISPEFERAEVYVGIAYPESAPEDISDAEVILSDSRNHAELAEVQPGLYQDLNDDVIIRPNNKYHLQVKTFDGKTYSDSTIVPAIPEIINFFQGDTLHFFLSNFEDRIPVIKFRENDFTHGYFLSTIIEENDSELYTSVKTESLQAEIPIPTFGINWFSDTLIYRPAKLQVWALDSSAVYIDNQYISSVNRIKWNLFGSMSMSEIDVTIELIYKAPK